MTMWLTDCPGSTRGFLPPGVDWRPANPSSDPSTQRLMEAFNPGKTAWMARAPDKDTRGGDRCIILIDDAGTSQFDTALAFMKQGGELPDGLICLALTGKQFRGQRQRPWMALRGNLHLTSHYAVHLDAAAAQAAATMIPAVVATEAIASVSGHRLVPAIKWVNDVWVNQAKVSGVLTATGVRGTTMDRVTFGIGINVEQSPEIEPSPFVPRAGSLAETDAARRGALPQFFASVVEGLDQMVDLLRSGEHERIFERYRARAGFVGEEVRIWPEGTEDWRAVAPMIRGRVRGLNPDLSLNIEGWDQPVRAGRLAYESTCREQGLA